MNVETERLREGVVVTTTHPKLGQLYWLFSDESSVGAQGYYGLTDSAERAVLLDAGWREKGGYTRHGHHVAMAIRTLEEGQECWHERAGQTLAEFCAWLRYAPWIDQPAPARKERLIDHGYFYEWVEVA